MTRPGGFLLRCSRDAANPVGACLRPPHDPSVGAAPVSGPAPPPVLRRVISGGQAGVDRAALDVALEDAVRAEESAFEALYARVEDPGLRQTLLSRASSGAFDVNPQRMVSESVKRVKQKGLTRTREALDAEMRKLEREAADPARLRELLAEKMHLDSEITKLDPAGDQKLHWGART